MPAKSKKQFKFMKAVESGNIKAPGLSKEKAKEYTGNTRFSALKNKMSNKKRK